MISEAGRRRAREAIPDAPSNVHLRLQTGFRDGDLTPVEHVADVLARLRADV